HVVGRARALVVAAGTVVDDAGFAFATFGLADPNHALVVQRTAVFCCSVALATVADVVERARVGVVTRFALARRNSLARAVRSIAHPGETLIVEVGAVFR